MSVSNKDQIHKLLEEGIKFRCSLKDSTDSEFAVWKTKLFVQIARIFGENSVEFRLINEVNLKNRSVASDIGLVKQAIQDTVNVLQALYDLEADSQ